MDSRSVFQAFVAGLVSAPIVNVLFPIIVSSTVENSQSLPLHTKLVLWFLPFALLLVLFFAVIDSEESFVASGFGVAFSIAFMGGIGIAGFVTLVAYFLVGATDIVEIG